MDAAAGDPPATPRADDNPAPASGRPACPGNLGRWFLPGCAAITVLGIALVALLSWRLDQVARDTVARQLLDGTEAVLHNFGIPEETHETILEPLRAFAASLQRGEIPLRQAVEVSDALMDGTFFRMVPFAGFEARFLHGETSDPDGQHEEGVRIVRQFLGVLQEGQVDILTLDSLQTLILEEREGTWFLREHLSAEDRDMARTLMRQAIQEAEREPVDLDVDLAASMRAILRRDTTMPPGTSGNSGNSGTTGAPGIPELPGTLEPEAAPGTEHIQPQM